MNLNYYLLIFQLEAYRPNRFLLWLKTHYSPLTSHPEKQPVWTAKAKLIFRLSIAWLGAIAFYTLLNWPTWLAIVVLLALWINSFALLFLAWMLIKPYEILNRERVKFLIRSKIKGLTDLRVIGITGSYGKTSTKMVLQPLLPKSLMTPKSYNTMFGIYKVVDYELCDRFRYFICEMGAYKIGDIKEFCDITLPTVGILTGINEQHLERFGSIENTISAKFEILQNLRSDGIGVVNLDNDLVRKNLSRSRVPLIGYTVDGNHATECRDIVLVKNWKIENSRTEFEFSLSGKSYQASTPLLGRGHLSNVLASIATASLLGEEIHSVIKAVANLPQIPHRLERRQATGFTILDNTYSSNPDGFRESLGVLKWFSGKKVLVTPGIVELGEEVETIHFGLGKLAGQTCDEIILVGDNRQTKALRDGIVSSGFNIEDIKSLRSRSEVPDLLAERRNTGQVVLLENDLPDQYL